MSIQQLVPIFGRLKVRSPNEYVFLVKQVSRLVKSDFVTKGNSEFESDGYLRYHALTNHHIVDEVGFDAAFSGSPGDSRHSKISEVADGIDLYLWRRAYYWRDNGMEVNVNLNGGSRRRE